MKDTNAIKIDKMFEYNLWANTTMINLCRQLDDEQLDFEIEGAYGGIRSFLIHIARAEGNYVKNLSGNRLWAIDMNWDNLSLDTIYERAQLSGQRLIDLASTCNPNTQHEGDRGGQPFTFYNWTVLAQAFSHGMEHRTHIKVLLTQLGIEHGDFSVWHYMDGLQ